jgi:hypothetical protein
MRLESKVGLVMLKLLINLKRKNYEAIEIGIS